MLYIKNGSRYREATQAEVISEASRSLSDLGLDQESHSLLGMASLLFAQERSRVEFAVKVDESQKREDRNRLEVEKRGVQSLNV